MSDYGGWIMEDGGQIPFPASLSLDSNMWEVPETSSGQALSR